ncbi:MAG: efflux RND transporter permease subunit [Planctomycetota bacterium]|nr:MAG: efflux RND transporter permease subunit [Planctomycetota bacterium]
MLSQLIAFSIKHSKFVLIAAGFLILLAGLKLKDMPVDVFPDLNAPTVVVMTESGGLAADEVETSVTFPIETAVNGLPGTRRVRSASATGLSIVWVEFDWGTDIYRARQLVAERLSAVRESLPPNAHAEITPVTSITGEIMLLALSSPDASQPPLALRSFAEFDLRNAILAVPGVAQVVAIGGELPQYQVDVRQDLLALHGLTIADVVEAARGAHSIASAGYIANAQSQEIPIRQMARVAGVQDIEQTLVKYEQGSAITIGEVAEVRLGAAPKRGAASDDGLNAVVVSVQKSPGTNTLALTQSIDSVLDQLERSMPTGIKLNRDPFRASRFIDRSINNVVRVLIEATIIVAIILILFLLDIRATIISLTALPLALAMAILVLWIFGLSVNVMTLGGLAVAIGELVDDAIIDVENVLRRLRENAARALHLRTPAEEVIYTASNEIRSSVVIATVIICIVFVPLLFLEGLEGRFFQPLGIAYIVSILASLAVALTVTPALCKMLFAKRFEAVPSGDTSGNHEGALVRWLKRKYQPLLETSLRRRGWVLGGAAAMTLGALALVSTFGSSFLPAFKEGTFTVFLMAPPGTSLAESDRLARSVETQLTEINGVRSVTRRTGRAERDEHAEPVSSSEVEVTMEDGTDQDQVRRDIDRIIANIPGITTMVGQPIEHRLSHILSGTPAAVAISVYGKDLGTLRTVAKEIETALMSLEGTRDVAANREVMITSLPIRYRAQDLAAVGLSPASAAEQVQQALYGERVAEVNEGVRRYDIVVRLAQEERERVEQIMDLQLRGIGGATVRLREVADIGPERTSNLISRENAQRKAVISTNIAEGYNLGDLVREVQLRVDPIVARAGCTVHYGGQFEAQQSASRTIYTMGAGVAVVMFMLLQWSTKSARTAALVMLNLPLALIGGILAVYITESPSIVGNTLALAHLGSARYIAPVISIASMVGFVTLFGIAVRNGILLVNHYDHIESVEKKPLATAIVQGSMERLVPILMTALTAALGLVPLAMASGKPGSELLSPLAIVVLGGLLSSTVLNLFVIPAGYSLAFKSRLHQPSEGTHS